MTHGSSDRLSARGLTACHECDLLHRLAPLEPGERALCTRCGALLYRRPPGGADRPLALASAAMLLFLIANLFPFIALKLEGRVEENLATVIPGVSLFAFAGLIACTTAVVASFDTSLVWPRMGLLLEQGTHGRSMYLVLSGDVEVIRHDTGEARRIARRGAGDVFGEVGYVRETQRTADVRALTAGQAIRFDFERMRRDLRYFPRIVAALNFHISRILGERLADVMDSADHHAGQHGKTVGDG